MSVEAITWALKQPIGQSSAKFVLVVLANCSSAANSLAYPSIAYLADATGQNRKTVIAGLARLVQQGYIAATADRRGETRQIVVYKLLTEMQRDGDLLTERHYCYRVTDEATGEFYLGVRTCLGEPAADTGYCGSGRWAQACALRNARLTKTIVSVFSSRIAAESAECALIAAAIADSLCRNLAVPAKRPEIGTVSNSTENGIVERVPKTASNSPKKCAKQSQKRDTEPLEPSGTVIKRMRGARLPDDWIPSEALRAEAEAAHPRLNLDKATIEFRNFWRATPDPKGRSLDWNLVWANRINQLAEQADRRNKPPGPKGPTPAAHTPYRSTRPPRGDPTPMPASACDLAKQLGIRPGSKPSP